MIFVNRYFHPDNSATSQMLSDLAFALAGAGRTVHVVTSDERIDDSRARLARAETVAAVRVHRLRGTRLGRGSLAARAIDTAAFHAAVFFAVLRLVERGDVVVAQTDPPLLSVTVAVAARMRGAALVNWLHDLFPEIAEHLGIPGLGGPVAGALRAVRDRSLAAARVNVAIGERMARTVRARGIAPERIRVVHNWCDGDAIVPAAAGVDALRQRWGAADRFVVMYSGNMGRAHVFDGLLDAAVALRDEARIAFVLVGGGPRRREVERVVRARSLDNVTLVPAQPRASLPAMLGAADLHVVSLAPALEGFVVPSKLYSAMAAGRPVLVLGDPAGEAARIVSDAGCGTCAAAHDGPAIADAIAGLAGDERRCAREGQAARAAFDRHYTAARAHAEWGEVIDLAAGVAAPVAERREGAGGIGLEPADMAPRVARPVRRDEERGADGQGPTGQGPTAQGSPEQEPAKR